MNRTLIGMITTLFCVAAMMATVRADEVYLFADDVHISSNVGLVRTVTPAEKLPEPVIKGDKPWQKNPYTYGTVIFDEEEGIYKAWYQSINSGPVRTPLLYNVSKDGRNWTPPNVGLVDWNGSKENNMLLKIGHLYSPSVIKDDNEKDPAKKYKLAYWDIGPGGTYGGKGGMYIAFSPDGIHFTPQEGGPVLVAKKETGSVSDVLDVMIDPKTGKYLMHAKTWRWEEGAKAAYRMITKSESDDFITWSKEEMILDTRAEDKDQPQTYGMPVFEYEGHYWGLLRIYHKPGNETIEIELAHSRNDKDFKRIAPGEPLIPVGKNGTWDDGMIFTCMPIKRGDTFEIFYGGWDGPHNKGGRNAAIGLATMKVGRLVALTPKGDAGVLLTEPLELKSGALSINADAGDGSIRAALVAQDGATIEGFTLDDSVAFRGDQLRHVLKWKDADLASLPKTVRIRFELTGNAKLYEVRAAEPSNDEPAGQKVANATDRKR